MLSIRFNHITCCTLIVLLATVFSSCQQDAQPQDGQPCIYANLFVRYIAPQAQLKVTAAFREGDSINTAQPIEIPGGVKYQGQSLESRMLPGQQVRYIMDSKTPFATEHRFLFKDTNGKEQDLSLTLAPIDEFGVIGGSASLSEGMKLFIKGEQIEQDESIVLLFSDAENRATTITLTNPAARDTFPIAGVRLRKLKPGPHKIYLVKKQHQVIDLNGIQTTADIEYYTAEQAFQVTE